MKNWSFDQWISVRFFKLRHLTLERLYRIHVPLVHREISNHFLFSTKFKSYKSLSLSLSLYIYIYIWNKKITKRWRYIDCIETSSEFDFNEIPTQSIFIKKSPGGHNGYITLTFCLKNQDVFILSLSFSLSLSLYIYIYTHIYIKVISPLDWPRTQKRQEYQIFGVQV